MDWSQYRWTERDNPLPSVLLYEFRPDSRLQYPCLQSGNDCKRNSLNKLWIAVNNILDTKPVAKAQVTIYNFQLQPIGKGETNGEGLVEITPKGVPFIAWPKRTSKRRMYAWSMARSSRSAGSMWEEKTFRKV